MMQVSFDYYLSLHLVWFIRIRIRIWIRFACVREKIKFDFHLLAKNKNTYFICFELMKRKTTDRCLSLCFREWFNDAIMINGMWAQVPYNVQSNRKHHEHKWESQWQWQFICTFSTVNIFTMHSIGLRKKKWLFWSNVKAIKTAKEKR